MNGKPANLGFAFKVATFSFKATSEKEAYLMGCKKMAKIIATKKYQNLTTKIINCGDNLFQFIVYTMLDITDEQRNFCKMCKEMHCSFFINEDYNCARCNYKSFMRRMLEKLRISKSYYREQFKK